MVKIIAISDLHGNLIDINPCDVLLICGDISPLAIQKDYIEMTKWIFGEFMDWINKLPCDQVYLTPGNHDFWFEKFCNENMQNTFKYGKLEILMDKYRTYYKKDSLECESITIYGTPWCKRFGNWAFMNDYQELTEKYSKIPEDIDILVTHDAPDFAEVGYAHIETDTIPLCNLALTDAVRKVRPKYMFCGHIHSGNHELTEVDIPSIFPEGKEHKMKIANCSILNENYKVHYKPLEIEIKPEDLC